MNRTSFHLGIILSLAALVLSACSKQPEKTTGGNAASIQSVDQKASYGVGYNLGRNLGQEKLLELDRAALTAGLEDGLANTKPRLPEADLNAAFATLRQRATAAIAAEGEKQLAAGRDFLAKNKTKSGVKVTASGLQYEVMKSGFGAKPKTTNTVQVHYHGTLIDGRVFDSSVQRGQPIEFALTGVIPGWTEALQLMSIGDKWRITVPPGLAYGAQGKGSIPPNAVLIFEVELLAIK